MKNSLLFFYFNCPSNQKLAYSENGFSELIIMRKNRKSTLEWQHVL